jgi:hypothetical protein
VVATESASPDAGGERVGRGRRRRSDLIVVGVVLALVGLSALGWWWRHPGMFGNQGNVVFIYSPVGTTAWLDLAQPLRKLEQDTVTIHSVEPQLVKGNATVEVVACGTSETKGGVGAVRGSLGDYCEWHMKAEGSTLRVDDQLLLRVYSDEPDRVVVRGVKVLYSHGWQRGSQVTGQTVRVRFGTKTVREHLTSR